MKIQRTIPPAAAPLGLLDFCHGVMGMLAGKFYSRMLKQEIMKYFGVKHVFLMSSGKASLTLILRALSSESTRSEVIIPAYTCYSVPSAIIKAGLKITLCDIDEATLDYDYRELKTKASENTLCILSANLFGIPSEADRIRNICQIFGAIFVEDAAQAMGTSYQHRFVGTNGDVGFFSLGRGKNVACNSGGIIVTDSDILNKQLAKIYADLPKPGISSAVQELIVSVGMFVFMKPFLYWLPSGLPFLRLGETIFYTDFDIKKLSGMKAGLMARWKTRLRKSESYRICNISKLCDNDLQARPCIRLPCILKKVSTAESIYKKSNNMGLGVSKMYPTAINDIPEIKHMFEGESYPVASSVSKRLLGIPTHQLMKDKDIYNLRDLFKTYKAGNEMCKYVAGPIDI